MDFGAERLRRLTAASALAMLAAVAMLGTRVEAQSSDGHALAQKFATESDAAAKEAIRKKAEAKRRADEKRKRDAAEHQRSDEQDMLARARAEADERRAEQQKSRAAEESAEWEAAAAEAARKAEVERLAAETAQKVEAERVATEAARKAEAERVAAEAARKAEAERVAAEAARKSEAERVAAEAARKAEAERVATEAARKAEMERVAAESARKSEAERVAGEAARKAEAERIAAEAARKAEAERVAEAHRMAAEAARRDAMAREREDEAERIAVALRQARAAQAARQEGRDVPASGRAETTAAMPEPTPRNIEPPRTDAEAPAEGLGRIAVLLQMEPGNRGIRRHNKTGDPVLCGVSGCYVSNGPDTPATFMAGHKALGLGRTLGERAGACSNTLSCVFRNVDPTVLGGMLQPVDMRVMRHDRREAQAITGSSDCDLRRGRLTCQRTLKGADYALWIVPERLAQAAGPGLLQQAVSEGAALDEHAALPEPR